MCWLGLAVKPEDIYRLIRHIDSDNDGYISFFDFKSALDMYAGNVSVDKSFKKEEFNSVVPQQKIQEFYEMEDGAIRKTSRKVSQGELQKFRVSQKPAIGYECVWTSRGTMSRAKCSIWIPNLKRGFMAPKHKKRICIGYYANVGYGDPRSSGSIAGIGLNLLELTDYTHAGVRFTGSKIITIVRDKFCPHPIRFHQVWSQYKGEKPLFAWEPIPPSEDFRSLGMVVTTSDTAPPLTCVRCIPKRWTKKSENEKNFKRNCEKISIFAGQRAQPYAEKEQIWTSELRKLCLTAKNEKNTFTERTRATAERVVLF